MNSLKSTSGAILAVLFFVGCGDSSNNEGTLSLDITDAPVDGATEVVVKFTAIELKPSDGPSVTITFDQAKSIDLLALQNGNNAALLDDENLEAGQYNWMRLLVDANEGENDSYISFEDGLTYSLYIPSGANTGLKLNRPFIIPVGGNASFTIDFDLRKSVLNPGNNSDDYKLKPTLRIEDNSEVGTIVGSFAASLVADDSCAEGIAVYAYTGSGITADDEGSSTAPLTSVIPIYDGDTDQYDFQFSYISAGDYTLALTCDADNDDPETNEDAESWSVLTSLDVTVVAFETEEVVLE